MIRKRYELVINDKVVLRLRPETDKVRMQNSSSYSYSSWEDAWLEREHVLELRDTLDEILQSWFCNDKPKTLCPICEREYGGIVPIVFNPADVGRLDMGEPTSLSPEQVEVGRAAAKRLAEKMKLDPHYRPVGCGEDEIEEARRTC